VSERHFLTRYANSDDAASLIVLMKRLAAFEGYLDRFAVKEADLLERGFNAQRPQFAALVCQEDPGDLIGYAVVYVVLFTFDLAPTLVLKELYVTQEARGTGVGKALMNRVIDHARAEHCGLLKWDVLRTNTKAKKFYTQFGGMHDSAWENWAMRL
jgi:GNAT superfamily N-acetyltransferase